MDERMPIKDPAAALRVVRAMKVAFVLSALLFLYIVIRIPATSAQPLDSTVEAAFVIAALTMVFLGFAARKLFARAVQNASATTIPAADLQRWLAASVISFAFLEACSLIGVALHFIGAALWHSELLIGVGIVATAFFSAGAPPGSEESRSL